MRLPTVEDICNSAWLKEEPIIPLVGDERRALLRHLEALCFNCLLYQPRFRPHKLKLDEFIRMLRACHYNDTELARLGGRK